MTGKRHPFHVAWKAGFDDDGRIVALATTLTSDGGWSLDLSEPVMGRALCHVDNAYWIPHFVRPGAHREDEQDLADRIPRLRRAAGHVRDRGRPRHAVAPLLGIDAATLRERNLYAPGQTTPYGQPVRHAERLRAIWEELGRRATSTRGVPRIAAFNAEHDDVKRGLAITPVKFGISFTLTAYNQAGALVHVYKDGSVLVNHGGTEMGQGLHTKMLQVAATALGAAARVGAARADAHRQGAEHLGHRRLVGRRPQRRRGEARLRADPRPDGRRRRPDARGRPARRAVRRAAGSRASGASGPSFSFAEVVEAAYHQRVQLWAAGFYRTAGLHWDTERMQGEPFKYFAYGAAATEVEVDGFTGASRMLRVDILHDVGDSLSPHHRPRAGRGRVRAGRRMAHARGAPLGRDRRPRSRPAAHPVGEHLQAAELLGDARRVQRAAARARGRGRRGLRVEGGRRAAVDARIQRARGDPRGGRAPSGRRGTGSSSVRRRRPRRRYRAIMAARDAVDASADVATSATARSSARTPEAGRRSGLGRRPCRTPRGADAVRDRDAGDGARTRAAQRRRQDGRLGRPLRRHRRRRQPRGDGDPPCPRDADRRDRPSPSCSRSR